MNENDLKMARDAFASSFHTQCVIEGDGVAGEQDSLGGTEFVAKKIRTLCTVDTFRSPREVAQGGQVIGSADHGVLLPFGTNASRSDVIIVGKSRFEVIGMNDSSDRFCETALTVKRGA